MDEKINEIPVNHEKLLSGFLIAGQVSLGGWTAYQAGGVEGVPKWFHSHTRWPWEMWLARSAGVFLEIGL